VNHFDLLAQRLFSMRGTGPSGLLPTDNLWKDSWLFVLTLFSYCVISSKSFYLSGQLSLGWKDSLEYINFTVFATFHIVFIGTKGITRANKVNVCLHCLFASFTELLRILVRRMSLKTSLHV
jgi:hypothetical protein